MKRIALYLICALITICAPAQDIWHTTSKSVKIEKAKKPHFPMKFEFYGKIGANIMSADFKNRFDHGLPSDFDLDCKSRFGIDLTFGFMTHFRPSRPSDFYWGGEFSLTQVGGSCDEFSFTHSYSSDYKYTYPKCSFSDFGVALAPVIGWKKPISNGISLDIHFNPGFFCKFKEKEIRYLEERYNQYDELEYSNGYYIRLGHIASMQFKGGVGLWFNRINVDVSYRYLTDFDKNYNIDYSNVLISLGYRF